MFLTLFLIIIWIVVSILHGKQLYHDMWNKINTYFKQKAFTWVLYFFHWLNDKNFLLREKCKIINFNYFSFVDFRERRREVEREGKNYQCERETLIDCLLHVHQPRTKPATQACALTENQTRDLLVCRMMPNQLSHSSRGYLRISNGMKL